MTLLECLHAIGPWERLVVWITAAIGIIFFLVAMYRMDKGSSDFALVDLVMEGAPPKASLNKLTIIVFAGLAVWVTVMSVLENRIDPNVSTFIVGVLGIFVLGRVGNQAVDRFSSRPARTQVAVESIDQVNVNEPDEDRPVAKPKRGRLLG